MKHTASIPNRAYELSQLPPIQLELSHLRFHILDISYYFPPYSCIDFKCLHIFIISLQIIEVKTMLLFNFDIFREREVHGWIIRRKSSTCWRRCKRIRHWNGYTNYYCIFIWENSRRAGEWILGSYFLNAILFWVHLGSLRSAASGFRPALRTAQESSLRTRCLPSWRNPR